MSKFQVGDQVRTFVGSVAEIVDFRVAVDYGDDSGLAWHHEDYLELVERPYKAKPLHLVVEPNLGAAIEAFRRASALAAGAPTRQNTTRLSVEYPDHEVWWVSDDVALHLLDGLKIRSWSTDWAAFRGRAPSEDLQTLLNRNLAKSKRVAW